MDHTTPLDRWDRRARVPLVALGIVFILGFSVFVIAVDLPPWMRALAGGSALLTWFAFAADFAVRLRLSPRGHRGTYVLHHPLQVLALLLPVFRAVRVVDLVRQIPYFHRRTGSAVRAQVIGYAAASSVVFVYFLALSTLQAERDAPGATITSFGTSIWWACVTLTTVGYGDVYPVTMPGRFFAMVLMLGGIVIIGVTSGTVMSYITDRIRRLDT